MRYILIENHSGYIWGDTADLDGPARDETPIEAASRMDALLREPGYVYEEVSRHALASNETGYHVYRADVGGSEAVPVVENGQDEDMIAAVERDCEYLTTIRCRDQDSSDDGRTDGG